MNETDKILIAIEDFFDCNPLLDQTLDTKTWEKAYQSDFPSSVNGLESKQKLDNWCCKNGIRKIFNHKGLYILKNTRH
jgi:hypothetical protein